MIGLIYRPFCLVAVKQTRCIHMDNENQHILLVGYYFVVIFILTVSYCRGKPVWLVVEYRS
jgi:hypothetical protein